MALSNTSHSLILSDAIAILSKTVTSELAAVENEARVEIAEATVEAREARRERDAALKSLHDIQLQEQLWKQDVATWKTAVEKSEMSSKHQAETISQLRQESRQWKDQCLRHEETSRREALDWKEQFLRVEQERRSLICRIDELVEEKIAYSAQMSLATNYYNSNSQFTEMPNLSSSSSTTKRGSSSSNPFQTNGNHSYKSRASGDSEESHAESSSHNSTRISQKSHKTSKPRHFAPSHSGKNTSQVQSDSNRPRKAMSPSHVVRQKSRSEPYSHVIRRVQAVIEMPVKQEDLDEENDEPIPTSESVPQSASASISPIDSPTTEILHARKTVRKSLTSTRRIVQSEEDESYEDESGYGGGRPHAEDDDDELMLGAENNPKEVYGTPRLAMTPHHTTHGSRLRGSSAHKRKQPNGRVSGGSASKVRRLQGS